jgi:DNA-binding CsgD family transcriptional regulator
MPILEHHHSYRQIETVIDLAVALIDYTQAPERCRDIPQFLGKALGVNDLTLAIVCAAAADPRIILCCSSMDHSTEEQRQILECQLVDVHRRYRYESRDDKSEFAHVLHVRNAGSGDASPDLSPSLGTVVFARSIDPDHDLLIMIRRTAGAGEFQFEVIEDLQILTNELAKQFQCTLAWQRCRANLGKPFSELTDQEWNVLRALMSDASEKQLAHRLDMRPHTLHSRIKSVYRKLGVNGRLPMIQKLNAAISEMRIKIHRTHLSHITAARLEAEMSAEEFQAAPVAEAAASPGVALPL